MVITDYPELTEQIYTWLGTRMKELSGPRSGGIHLTELIYCLTASYWKRLDPLPNTGKQDLTMALGIGLERVFIAPEVRAKVGTKDGIDYSPDFWFGEIPSEMKTTRMSTKKT